MKISIITPIYRGNHYLEKYLNCAEEAIGSFPEAEIIWINDSPEVPLVYPEEKAKKLKVKILNNKRNIGIHGSRVRGLELANGEYILFLDQDDQITSDALKVQYEMTSSKPDLILGNGYFEDSKGLHKIFDNRFSQRFAAQKKPYLMIRDFIVSPGQCLVRRKSIPDFWRRNVMQSNGADDYFLWLLMFNDEMRIVCNYECVYIHGFTDNNYSADLDKMYFSVRELLRILRANTEYKQKDYSMLQRAIYYKRNYKKDFLRLSIKNMDIFLYNVLYRLLWRGYLY